MKAAIVGVALVLAASGIAEAKTGSSSSPPKAYRAPKLGSSYGGDHSVSGHVTRRGTYVAPYKATDPNRTKNDNYSTRPNVNPYTGKAGSKKRDGE